MPQLDDSGEALLNAGRSAHNRAKEAWEGLSDFALRDNVLEIAVGLMYGLIPLRPFSAFSRKLHSLTLLALPLPSPPSSHPSSLTLLSPLSPLSLL